MGQGAGGVGRGHDVSSIVATVGGLGYLPWAPGTWGSAVGLILGLLCVRTLSWSAALIALPLSFVVGALVCTHAERALGQHDPPAVILDEVWGMAAVILIFPWITFSWALLVVAFLSFRAFDILKPPPLKRLARLRGGWGIMADDAGAAAYTALVLFVAAWLWVRQLGIIFN